MEQSLVIDEFAEEDQAPPPMEEIFEEEYDYQYPKRGDIRQAVVLSIEPHQIIVDIGTKRDGIVPDTDLERLSEEEIDEIEVGGEMPVYVLKSEDSEGSVIVSVNMALVHEDWLRAEEYLESGEVYEGEISKFNKGGLIAPFGRISGFIPASQVVNMPRRLPQDKKMEKLSEFVGGTLPLKIIEVHRRRRRLIFSERAAQREWREQQKQQLMDELYEGEVRKGTVSSLCNFGAFVDLGGADGLVHISELAWHRVKHPREVLSVGDEVEVYVLRLDHERGRIGLSTKRLQPDPWTLVDEKYHVGQVVQGKVTNVVAFGAFARLEPGVEGLIHVSELAEGKVDHPSSVVKKGDELTLRIISINARRRRIGLSLRQAPPPEELVEEEEEEPAPEAEPVPEEVEPAIEEAAVPEEEAETAVEVEEQEEAAAEVEEGPEPELDSEEDEPAAEEPAVPEEEEQAEAGLEEEEEGPAEVEEEPQPEPAPEGEAVPDEVEETAQESAVSEEEEEEEQAEAEEEPQPEPAPESEAVPDEVEEAGEEPSASEEEAEVEDDDKEEEGDEAPQVEAAEETSEER